jgi:hypothetical protein
MERITKTKRRGKIGGQVERGPNYAFARIKN